MGYMYSTTTVSFLKYFRTYFEFILHVHVQYSTLHVCTKFNIIKGLRTRAVHVLNTARKRYEYCRKYHTSGNMATK